jgi:hypothetical protein
MKKLVIFSVTIIFITLLMFNVSASWWSNLFKISSEEKQVIKREEVKTTLSNYERGMQWEKTAQKGLCNAVGGCLLTAESAAKKLRWTNYQEEVFMIYGGKATKKFINSNGLYNKWFTTFKREPDFLEIKHINGKITEITIFDAKTSLGAIRAEQDADFIDFCRRSNIKCRVEYVIPEKVAANSDANFVCLATPALGITGPVGWTIEGLCFFAVF